MPLTSRGGAVTQLRQVLPCFAREPDVEWMFAGAEGIREALGSALDGFEVIAVGGDRLADRLRAELDELPRLARAWGADAVFGPLGLYSPPLMGRLVWIPHNVAPYSEQYIALERLEEQVRLRALRWAHVFAARHAAATLCLSEHGRRLLAREAGMSPGRLFVAHHGAEVEGPPPALEMRRALCSELGIDEPFVLSVAHGYRYKNLVELVAAFALLVGRVPLPTLRLVLAGAWPDPEYEARVRSEVARHEIEGRVSIIGPRRPDELAALETEALVIAATSWLENCPTSLLEQLHLGCAIVCSAEQPMPEHAGSAAVYVDVDDPESIATGLESLVRSGSLRADLRANARARSRDFTWDDSAAKAMGLLRDVACGRLAASR